MKPISENIDKVLRTVFSKHSKAFAEIMINWPKVAGAKFGSSTSPMKISNITEKKVQIKVLYVKVSDSATGLEFTYHQDIILERIAVYFGYRAVDKLRVVL
jgi:hypothetical protein